MHLLRVVIISLLLVGCSEESRRELFPNATERAQQLDYYKDKRTNLCFVHNSVTNSNGFSRDIYTNVPCTPEVEKLIK